MPARKPVDMEKVLQLRAARQRFLETGEDEPLRRLTAGTERFVAECLVKPEDPWATVPRRRRKYSDPLFVTPRGLLRAFPNKDEDLFLDHASAWAAIAHFSPQEKAGDWTVYETKLETLLRSKRYLRWSAEVKSLPEGVGFREPRRPLAESFALYSAGGMEALRARYTRTHCLGLLRKFRAEGWLPTVESSRPAGLFGFPASAPLDDDHRATASPLGATLASRSDPDDPVPDPRRDVTR